MTNKERVLDAEATCDMDYCNEMVRSTEYAIGEWQRSKRGSYDS
jgi:hypothetical protein